MTAVKTHMGRQKIQSSPSCLVQWQTQKLDRFHSGEGKIAHQSSRVPGSRSWHTQHPWRGHPSKPGLWHTCSSSSSPFPLEPFTAISGALTTVTWWCCRSRACFPPGEPPDPAEECRRRAGMSALHSLSASKGTTLINGKQQEPAEQDNWGGEAAQRGLSLIPQGQSNCYQTGSRANLSDQITTAHSRQHHHIFPLGLTDPLASLKNQGTRMHIFVTFTAKRGFSSYAKHSLSSLTTFPCCQESCLALSSPPH